MLGEWQLGFLGTKTRGASKEEMLKQWSFLGKFLGLSTFFEYRFVFGFQTLTFLSSYLEIFKQVQGGGTSSWNLAPVSHLSDLQPFCYIIRSFSILKSKAGMFTVGYSRAGLTHSHDFSKLKP